MVSEVLCRLRLPLVSVFRRMLILNAAIAAVEAVNNLAVWEDGPVRLFNNSFHNIAAANKALTDNLPVFRLTHCLPSLRAKSADISIA